MFFFHPLWPVFYEDNHLLVVYKPSGLVVQRDHKNKANLLDMVKAWLKQRHGKPGNVFAGMVHRLDGPVAGVMVVARTSKAASRLSAQFRDGRVEKTYWAVVQGQPPGYEGRLEHRLMRHGRLSRVVPDRMDSGKKACLRYHQLARDKGRSLLEVGLETGRRHQIRVQLAAVGCPILGDLRYGAAEAMEYGRIALLARKLAFKHPTRGELMQFLSPLPGGWCWPVAVNATGRPLWSIEQYRDSAAGLPFSV